MNILSRLSLLTASVTIMSLSGIAVVAALPNTQASAAATTGQSATTTTGQSATASSQASTRLADAKLLACQKRETAINNILSRLSDRGQKQLDLFTSIATKTEAFYTSKGKTLSNYDALVADVNAKQVVAQTEVSTIKSDSVKFKCDGTDPKGAIASFKDALKAEIVALKNYKTSVRNLIVGVKSVQSTTTKTTGGY